LKKGPENYEKKVFKIKKNRRNEIMKTKLKKLRKEKGLKACETAWLSGVSIGHYSLVENGWQKPSDEFKEKISKTLELPVGKIFPVDSKGGQV